MDDQILFTNIGICGGEGAGARGAGRAAEGAAGRGGGAERR